jgi:hypothetical protein
VDLAAKASGVRGADDGLRDQFSISFEEFCAILPA